MTGRRQTAGVVLGTVLVGLISTGCATVRGPEQTQTRTVGAVSTVDLATSGELVLTGGSPPSLRITAGENVLGHLTSDVRGDRLTLGSDGAVHDVGPVRYDLTLPAARAVELSGSGIVRVSAPSALRQVHPPGSGIVRVDGLKTEELTVDLSGSGQVTVAGSTTRQQVSIGGSGRYSAGRLASQDAEVTIAGSGSADVTVDRTLTARISGSGTITYTGSAAVTSSVTGSGAVVHR
ncbi:MAG: head GIN domain-containing protein [Blastococcus sp.]